MQLRSGPSESVRFHDVLEIVLHAFRIIVDLVFERWSNRAVQLPARSLRDRFLSKHVCYAPKINT